MSPPPPDDPRVELMLRDPAGYFEDDSSFDDSSLCAHCSDRWAENVAAVVVEELGRNGSSDEC